MGHTTDTKINRPCTTTPPPPLGNSATLQYTLWRVSSPHTAASTYYHPVWDRRTLANTSSVRMPALVALVGGSRMDRLLVSLVGKVSHVGDGLLLSDTYRHKDTITQRKVWWIWSSSAAGIITVAGGEPETQLDSIKIVLKIECLVVCCAVSIFYDLKPLSKCI